MGSDTPDQRAASSSDAAFPSGHFQVARSERADGAVVLLLSGELDIEAAPVLAAMLDKPEIADAAQLVLDLSGVTFIDSIGVGVLVKAEQHAERTHRQLLLTNVPKNVDRLLTVTGITEQFTID